MVLILVALTITATAMFSQNSLNPKKISGYNFSSTFIDKDYFKHNFIRGYNWAASSSTTKNLDFALGINTYHAWNYWLPKYRVLFMPTMFHL